MEINSKLQISLLNLHGSKQEMMANNDTNVVVSDFLNDNFFEHNKENLNISVNTILARGIDVSSYFTAGFTEDINWTSNGLPVTSLFNDDTRVPYSSKDYIISGETFLSAPSTTDTSTSPAQLIAFSKAVFTKVLCQEHLKISAGYNFNINNDKCNLYRGGWFDCNPIKYVFEGPEIFYNPFMLNLSSYGVKCQTNNKNIKCFINYGVLGIGSYANALKKPSYAQWDEDSESNEYERPLSNGLFSSKTPYVFDVGLSYDNNTICPIKTSLVYQKVDPGNLTFENTEKIPEDYKMDIPSLDDIPLGNFTSSTFTEAASRHMVEKLYDNKLKILTGICSSEIKDTQIGFSLSCTKNTIDTYEDDDDNDIEYNKRLLKWRIGCLRECAKIKCLKQNYPVAFGLNAGTPTYLYGEDDRWGGTPIIFEAACLFNICGFNVPIFADCYINKDGEWNKDELTRRDGNQGNAFICGIRPSKILGVKTNDYSEKFTVSCPEGSLDED